MFHHVRIINFIHRRHAAAGMPNTKITLEQFELFLGRPWAALGCHQIAVATKILALGGRWLEFIRDHPHRNAGMAIAAAWPIGDRLTAAKADPSKCFVQLVRMWPLQFGEYLALAPPRKIRARRGRGHKEAGKTNGGRHGYWRSSRPESLDIAICGKTMAFDALQ